MRIKTGVGRKNIVVVQAKNPIMRHAGKLHGKYKKKKINVDNVRNIVNYSNS